MQYAFLLFGDTGSSRPQTHERTIWGSFIGVPIFLRVNNPQRIPQRRTPCAALMVSTPYPPSPSLPPSSPLEEADDCVGECIFLPDWVWWTFGGVLVVCVLGSMICGARSCGGTVARAREGVGSSLNKAQPYASPLSREKPRAQLMARAVLAASWGHVPYRFLCAHTPYDRMASFFNKYRIRRGD